MALTPYSYVIKLHKFSVKALYAIQYVQDDCIGPTQALDSLL